MIVVICDCTIAPEKQCEYIEKINASGVIAKTHAEPGCISYELASIAGAPGKMYVVERWESMEALQVHSKGANMAEVGKLGKEYGVETVIKLYQAQQLN